MKIALVNLCKIEDFSKTKYYQKSLEFLQENNIDFVDYFSGRETAPELLSGFHDALRDDTIELVWFIQGGSELINFLEKIDWKLVERSNKEYLGLSDFTHFVFRAIKLGKTCYYGQGLQNIKDYLPDPENRKFIVDFLNEKKLPSYNTKLLHSNELINLENEKIIGGHSFISAIMLPETKIDLSERFLFFEHHYVPGERLQDIKYFLDVIKFNVHNNMPKGFILGHSMLFDQENQLIESNFINKFFLENLLDLKIPIYYIDHFKTIVKFL